MKRSLWVIAVLALALSACGVLSAQSKNTVEPQNRGQFLSGAAPAVPALPGFAVPPLASDEAAPAAAQPAGGQAASDVSSTSTERLVIQNAQLTIVVTDVNARLKDLEQMAQTMGGYVVSINVSQTYTADGTPVPDAQIVFRVPASQLDAALEQVKKDTVDVTSENRTGQDVTNQYVDLQSRLTAKQAAADQLLKIMQNANRTQDVLDVYQQLQQVQSDIEVLKGQIQYYQESAQLSAITVHIIAEKTVKPIEVGGWKPQGVARDAIQNLVYFWQDFVDFLINLFLLVLPVLITIAIPIFLIFLLIRWLVRKFFKPKAALKAGK